MGIGNKNKFRLQISGSICKHLKLVKCVLES